MGLRSACGPSKDSSWVQCLVLVSRITRRVTKVNRGGQLDAVEFEGYFCAQMGIILNANYKRLEFHYKLFNLSVCIIFLGGYVYCLRVAKF